MGGVVLRLVRMGALPAVIVILGLPAPPGRPISASTEGAGLPTVVSPAGRAPATAERALTRLTITTAMRVFPRPPPRPEIRLVRLGNCTTVLTEDAALQAVSMDAQPAAPVILRRPLQPLQRLQPPQPPQPPQRLRVLRGRSISAGTEGAVLPAVSMTGRVPVTAGRALIRLIITTVGSVFLRLHLRPGIRLVRLGNCTMVLMKDAALQVVRMDARPAVSAVRRRPLQPLQHLQRLQPLQRLHVLRARGILASTASVVRFRATASGWVPGIAAKMTRRILGMFLLRAGITARMRMLNGI